MADVTLRPSSPNLLAGIQGDSLEIVLEIEVGEAAEFGLALRQSPDREEETLLLCDIASQRVTIDRQRASLDEQAYRDVLPQHEAVRQAAVVLIPGKGLRLHVFLDRSVIEVFVDGLVTLTSRIYPTRSDSLGLELFVRHGQVAFKQIDVWTLRITGS
jgi:beta-fructofuranosidase